MHVPISAIQSFTNDNVKEKMYKKDIIVPKGQKRLIFLVSINVDF